MLAFIDVSGDPYGAKEKSPWIAIHTVCIKKRSIYDITAALHKLKRDILLNEYKELKATDLINRSTLNNPCPEHYRKYTFLEEIMLHCIDHCDCKHAAVVFENSGENKKSDGITLPRHYVDSLWRIEAIAREWKAKDVIVVIDNNTRKTDKNLAFAFNNYLYRSEGAKHLRSILPVPIFADSETTAGLQLADIAAGVVRNYYANSLQNGNEAVQNPYHEKLVQYFNILKNRSISRPVDEFQVSGIFCPTKSYRI